jgi:hypothetical protein
VRYKGQHQPIIDRVIWDAVQARLGGNVPGERRTTNTPTASLLAGLIVDEAGEPLVAAHACKGKVRYRYYVSHPGIAEAFWRDSIADGSIFSEWVVNVGRRDSLTRLAHVFCEMAVRCENSGHGDRRAYELAITQESLGDVTGLTGVHVNRTLKELRENGSWSSARAR